jgi:DNA-binding GntR family transcriptional regulator
VLPTVLSRDDAAGAPPATEESRAASTRYRDVSDRMRADILRGDLRPEMRLKLRELATRYGVSAAPIRESLQQLQGEGLVVMQPHRGASVRRIDEAMLINVFDVREAIESFLTMQFAASASPHQLAQLDALQSEHDVHVQSGDFAAAQSMNARFHRLINASARNQEALAILDRHLAMTRAFRAECGFNPMRMRATQAEHRELLAALHQRDAEAARRIAAWHVRSSRDDLLGRLRPFIAPQDTPGGKTE